MNYTPIEISEFQRKYRQNARSARDRGIEFKLTFDQWITLWKEHIHERGSGRDDYVLCRKDDLGCYELGNCYVATKPHNSSVRGYKETRTNCLAYGNHLDQLSSSSKRWSIDRGVRPTALGSSLWRAEHLLEPRAYRDTVKGLSERYLDRYRNEDPGIAEKVARLVLDEHLTPSPKNRDIDRARKMCEPVKKVRSLTARIDWLREQVLALQKPG